MPSVRPLRALAAAAVLAACGPAAPPPVEKAEAAAPALPAGVPAASFTPPPPGPRGIRGIDFRNLRYGAGRDTFTLAKGERIHRSLPGPVHVGWLLEDVTYGDATGDGKDDAIVTVDEVTGGSAAPSRVFVYTVREGRLAPLWDFATGDRAEGGLKDVRADGGLLVVELFGKGSRPGRPPAANDDSAHGLCCPTWFTRTRLRWTGRAFEVDAAPEVLPYSPDEP